MIGKAVYYALSNDSGVTDLVGTKIYPEIAPEGTTAPVVVFTMINSVPDYSRSGTGRWVSTVDVLVFDKSYVDCVDLAIEVRDALNELHGTFNTVTVQDGKITGMNGGYDIETDTFYHRISFEFKHN